MPALTLDGVHLADVDPEDAAILRELARRGRPGRLILTNVSGGQAEPFGTVEVEGETRLVVRADWIARVALHFAEDRVEGDQVEQLQAANDQGDQAQGRAAA